METRSEMETELQRQLQAANNSSLFPASRLTELIQNSYKTATTLFKWVNLARAKTTSTTNKGSEDDSYYDYPEEFRTNTVFRVQIDGKEYNRKGFESYLDYKNRYPSSSLQKRIFANYQRFIFIAPDTSVGTNNMDIWGIIQAPALSSASSETIFSGNSEEGNMAVISLALSTALTRIDSDMSEKLRNSALITLAKINNDEWAEYVRDQQIDTPLLEVPDFFGKPNLNNNIGQFSYDPLEHY